MRAGGERSRWLCHTKWSVRFVDQARGGSPQVAVSPGKFLTRHDSPLACPVIFTSEIVRVAQGEADDHVLGCAIHVARRIPRVLLQRSNSL